MRERRRSHETALFPGELIAARYRITRFIASGGMGNVYEALDLELGISVALKTIAGSVTEQPTALARLKREVLLARNVAHPNVCRSYDLGLDTARGLFFITMELLPGENLLELLAREGRLEPHRAIRILRQVAAALSAAHEAGVLHRDLKSSNLFIVPGPPERAVVGDFGLALALSSDPRPPSLSSAGAVVGTYAYMSPEQVRGLELGPASDIYSLGLVAYEMLTGVLPFEGGSAVSTAAKRLVEDPPSLGPQVPGLDPRLESVVLRCLEREPEDRFRSAAELEGALARLESGASRHGGYGTVLADWRRTAARRLSSPRSRGFVVASALLLLLALFLLRGTGRDGIPTSSPRQVTAVAGWAAEPAVSPDGSFIAFVVREGDSEDVWIMDRSGQGELRLTQDPALDRSPAWLPDGSALLFASNRGGSWAIWKVPVLGGNPTLLLEDARDPAVSRDGDGLAFVRRVPPSGELRVMRTSLTDPASIEALTTDGDGLWDHENPVWSPDGRVIAYEDERDIWLVEIGSGKPRRLTTAPEADYDPAWTPDGRHLYFTSQREGTLAIWRTPVDDDRAVRVTMGTGPERQPDVSADGSSLVYSTYLDDHDIVLVDRRTGAQQRLQSRRLEAEPALSPDGQRLVFSSNRRGVSYDLWALALDDGVVTGEPERLTDLPGSIACPAFSPDGGWLVFHRVVDGERDIWIMPAAGGLPRPLFEGPDVDIQPVWSPSGREIAFVTQKDGVSRIRIASVVNGEMQGEPRPLGDSTGDAESPSWSPDGSAIAYIGISGGGSNDVWVAPVDGSAPPRQLTRGARASVVAWEADGAWILVSGLWTGTEHELRRVQVASGEEERVTGVEFGQAASYAPFAVSADGRLLAAVFQESRGDIWILEASSPDRY